MQNLNILTVCDYHIDIGAGRDLCRNQFRIHSSCSHIAAGRRLAHFHQFFAQIFHYMDKLSIFIFPRVVRIKPVDIRKKNQKICPHQSGHDSGKAVIIPEFDLISSHGIVLIYNRNNAQFKQLGKGIMRIIPVQIIHYGILRH